MHILSPETDNCPSWISGRERMTVETLWDGLHNYGKIYVHLNIYIYYLKQDQYLLNIGRLVTVWLLAGFSMCSVNAVEMFQCHLCIQQWVPIWIKFLVVSKEGVGSVCVWVGGGGGASRCFCRLKLQRFEKFFFVVFFFFFRENILQSRVTNFIFIHSWINSSY